MDRWLDARRPGVLEIELSPGQDVVRLHLVGEADASNSDRIVVGFEEAVSRHPQRIEIDCGELDYLDSSGLGAVLRAWQSVRLQEIEVRVVGASPIIRKLFELSGVEHLLE